jgi:MoaA/NifB/PqqE/SkfB family radical SAM enzyme
MATFMDNRGVYLTNSYPKRGPLAVVFNLSPSCDAKCDFCEYWKKGGSPGAGLSTEDRLKVVRSAAACGVWMFSFCSAEPLLIDDLDVLIGEAKDSGMLVNVSTNGSRLEEKADMLARLGVDTVAVSIDSHVGAAHDSSRNFIGLFERLSRGIDKLRSSRKGKRPWIAARHLVSGRNYFEIRDLVRHWTGKVDEIVLKPVFRSQDGIFTIPQDMRVDPAKEKEFREYFANVLKEYPALNTPYHRLIPDYLYGKDPERVFRCFAGTFFADVDCGGNLSPCTEYGFKAGNVLEQGLLGVWASDGMKSFRKTIRENKKCAACWGDKFASGLMVERALRFMGGI